MVSKNFKFLYQYYKDKQEVLAQMLRVPQSNISAYVNGKKPIPTDVLHNISIRYNISVDDLINKDLSLEFDSPQTLTVDDAAHFSKKMFPILTSNVAKANDNFNTAHEILLQSLSLEQIDDFYKNIGELEQSIVLFQKAWDESNTYHMERKAVRGMVITVPVSPVLQRWRYLEHHGQHQQWLAGCWLWPAGFVLCHGCFPIRCILPGITAA